MELEDLLADAISTVGFHKICEWLNIPTILGGVVHLLLYVGILNENEFKEWQGASIRYLMDHKLNIRKRDFPIYLDFIKNSKTKEQALRRLEVICRDSGLPSSIPNIPTASNSIPKIPKRKQSIPAIPKATPVVPCAAHSVLKERLANISFIEFANVFLRMRIAINFTDQLAKFTCHWITKDDDNPYTTTIKTTDGRIIHKKVDPGKEEQKRRMPGNPKHFGAGPSYAVGRLYDELFGKKDPREIYHCQLIAKYPNGVPLQHGYIVKYCNKKGPHSH